MSNILVRPLNEELTCDLVVTRDMLLDHIDLAIDKDGDVSTSSFVLGIYQNDVLFDSITFTSTELNTLFPEQYFSGFLTCSFCGFPLRRGDYTLKVTPTDYSNENFGLKLRDVEDSDLSNNLGGLGNFGNWLYSSSNGGLAHALPFEFNIYELKEITRF